MPTYRNERTTNVERFKEACLDGRVQALLDQSIRQIEIAETFGVSQSCVTTYIHRFGLKHTPVPKNRPREDYVQKHVKEAQSGSAHALAKHAPWSLNSEKPTEWKTYHG